MEIAVKLSYIVLDLIMPLSVGYYCRRRNWFNADIFDTIIIINILGFATALSLLSFWALPLKFELLWLPFFGIILSVIPGIVAYFAFSRQYANGLDKGSYLSSAMLSNVGTLGGLCAFIIFGEKGFAYAQLVALFQNLVMLLFCFPMAQYYQQQSINQVDTSSERSFFSLFFTRNQIPVLGLLIGMGLYVSGIPRPAILGTVFNPLVHISAWTALLPVGYSIDFSAMRQYYRGILNLIPVKFIITPIFGYAIACQLFSDPVVLHTILLLASTPAGINAVVTARLYNLNVHIAGAAFVLTTALFLILVYPLLFLWITFFTKI